MDARNKSGHDDREGAAVWMAMQGRASVEKTAHHTAPRCHPGLVPGSRLSGATVARLPPHRGPGQAWTPEQVRGDKSGAETVSPIGTGSVLTLNPTAVQQVRA